MFRNRLTVIIAMLAVLVVSLAISCPLSMAGVSKPEGTNDFYQRHPERNWDETRSYIARGLALRAKDDAGALCR